jgi:ubiquitin-like 1-activating enzyme E1 B
LFVFFRLCLAANIPLVESGTAGYLGQVTVIRKVNVEIFTWVVDPEKKIEQRNVEI